MEVEEGLTLKQEVHMFVKMKKVYKKISDSF